ncbi:SMP-30/gluconolactonase/LRE family protein [Agrobacterium tumefaciens]|uniref:SMP-30/gluconolactonase/LRE family protein n=1 Tax=Agrobacterium tumefaciens TaxID=358 RepID=UPI00129B2BFE|nr:SMP-30/gluconolactonase/LRE family protein [Agrobacterium tumefaciens]MRH98794.1 SMP-30/gluconolactonase/LRE family protein [Agrobacterium tumefaciens]
MTKPDIEIIATGLHFPEGPVELPDGSAAVVEIGAGRIVRICEAGKPELLAYTGGGPNGMALGPDGALYVCNNGGFSWKQEGEWLRPIGLAADYSRGMIQRVDIATGVVTTLYDHCDGRPLSGPNDIVFDNHGGFYFTDTGRVRELQRDHGGIFYAKADGGLIKRVVFPFLTPNGIGLSPDLKTLYVAEMETARLWSYAIVEPGMVEKTPFPSQSGGELVVGLGGFQRFDSLKVAASGNICVATLVTGCITVVTPKGELLDQVWMPDIYPTNLGFIGQDLQDAIVTLSLTGQIGRLRWPEKGLRLQNQDVA